MAKIKYNKDSKSVEIISANKGDSKISIKFPSAFKLSVKAIDKVGNTLGQLNSINNKCKKTSGLRQCGAFRRAKPINLLTDNLSENTNTSPKHCPPGYLYNESGLGQSEGADQNQSNDNRQSN